MKPVHVPTSDVNSESGVITSWLADDGSQVDGGAVILEVETSKALLEVTAPESGVLLQLAAEGEEVALSRPVALLFPDKDALQSYEQDQRRGAAEAAPAADAPRASVKAVQRAAELGVDLAEIHSDGLITVQDVENGRSLRPRRRTTAPCPRRFLRRAGSGGSS